MEPIGNAGLQDQPTFYPVQPPPKDSFECDSENISIITWQRKFLSDNSNPSPHYQSIIDYHKAFMSGEITPEDLVESIKLKVEESEKQDPPLRCFTQLNWQLARQVTVILNIRIVL